MNELKDALKEVQTTYESLVEIADRLVKPYTTDIDELVQNTTSSVETLSSEELRKTMLTLSLKSYTLGEIKEKSALKLACAEALKEEAYARTFNQADGAIKQKENIALLETSYEILSHAVFNEVYSMLKTKSDECHRVVESIKNVLISRASELKISAITKDETFE